MIEEYKQEEVEQDINKLVSLNVLKHGETLGKHAHRVCHHHLKKQRVVSILRRSLGQSLPPRLWLSGKFNPQVHVMVDFMCHQ